jgi:hypothetical protein
MNFKGKLPWQVWKWKKGIIDNVKARITGKIKNWLTTQLDWDAYRNSGNVGGLLHGHDGSLGQSLNYFYKYRNSKSNSLTHYDVIFELRFSENAIDVIDYNTISLGGEGKGDVSGKLTGKSEVNDIFREAKCSV